MSSTARIHLHAQGPDFSRIAFGCWRLVEWGLDARGLRTLVESCLDLGITTFDHADIYGDYQCEQRFGEMLAGSPGLRARMQLASKCGIRLVSQRRPANLRHGYDTTAAHIRASAEHSLRVLHTDHLDLLLLHRPDPLMDADEAAGALDGLVHAGKVRHVGVSNFSPSQFELLAARLKAPLVTNQMELSPLNLAPFLDGTLDQCQRLRLAPMAWSPLAGGRLSTGTDERAVRVRAALARVAADLGAASPEQVAYAWLLRHPARILPVTGSGRIERVREAVGALALPLTREQWFDIWCASTGAPLP
jgi:predicted oxidoreductase